MSKTMQLVTDLHRASEGFTDYNETQTICFEGALEMERLAVIEHAALKLVKCKGRYHTEQNMIALGELLGVKMPPAICEKDDEKWINPNYKTQGQYLPWIGEEVLFTHEGKTYYGKHTGARFVSGHGFAKKEFVTWECKWMYLPKHE